MGDEPIIFVVNFQNGCSIVGDESALLVFTEDTIDGVIEDGSSSEGIDFVPGNLELSNLILTDKLLIIKFNSSI